jgi:Rrf2 family transcriptional regulator, cysteine metabolism repressor
MLVQLARRWTPDGPAPVSLAEVAAEEGLPRAYLEQLAIPLREAGIVVSTRGARGGYALARRPGAVTLAEALRALEGPLAPMICASEDPAHAGMCDRVGACSVNALWIKVRDAISGVLETTSLADLVPTPHLVELLARAIGQPGTLDSPGAPAPDDRAAHALEPSPASDGPLAPAPPAPALPV